MFSPIEISLLVLTVVAFAIMVRETTEYSPESAFRLWTTRLAVLVIMVWFATGLFQQVTTRQGHSLIYVLLSRGFVRGLFAILFIWVVFRDEL
jgi:hypothetical protein